MSGLSTNAKVAIGAAVGLLVAGGVYFFVSQKKTAKGKVAVGAGAAAGAAASRDSVSVEQAITIVKDVLELSITSMEDVVDELSKKYNYQKGDQMPPELVADINARYGEVYSAARDAFFLKVGLSEDDVTFIANKYMSNEDFQRVVQLMSLRKAQKFADLGLAIDS